MITIVFFVLKHMFSIAFKNVSHNVLECSSIYRVADIAIRRRENILKMALSAPIGSPLACKLMGLLLKGVTEEIRLFVFKVDPMIVKKELIILAIQEIAHGIYDTTLQTIKICHMMQGQITKCEETIALLSIYQLACGNICEAWDVALKGNSMDVKKVLENIDHNVANILLNLNGKRKVNECLPKIQKYMRLN